MCTRRLGVPKETSLYAILCERYPMQELTSSLLKHEDSKPRK